MFSTWRAPGSSEKASHQRRARVHGRRGATSGRPLRLEPLEIRALLNGGPGGHAGRPPSGAAAQLVLMLPRSAETGTTVMAEVAAVDAYGRLASSTDTINLSSASSGVVLPTNPTVTLQQGVAWFPVTFDTAGQDSLTASDATTTTVSSATAGVQVVNPAAVAQIVLFAPRSAQTGAPVTVEAVALNAFGQEVSSSDTLSVTTSDTAASPATQSVTLQNGSASFQVTFNTAGQESLTATDTTTTTVPKATARVYVVNPTAITQIVLLAPRSVQAGVQVTVEVAALNALGQVVSSSDTLSVTTSDTAALPATQSVTLQNGSAAFVVTFNTSGPQTLTATDGSGTTALSGTMRVYVAAAPTTPTTPTTPAPTTPTTPTTPAPTTPTTPTTPTGVTTTTTSSNWSGYAAETNLNNPSSGSVTAVSGTWVVPTVTGSGSGTEYSSVWVGIDGYSSSSVEQLGTEEDVVGGKAQYSAWYEMYPNYPVTINMTVHPGDTVSASVTYVSGQFVLSITDGSQKFSIDQSYAQAQRSSAEWIVEAPSSNSGVLPLAAFSTVAFTNCTATINGTTGAIDNSSWQAAAINMGTRSVLEDTASGLTDKGGSSSFTVAYDTSASTGTGFSQRASDRRSGPLEPLAASVVPVAVSWAPAAPAQQQARDQLFGSLDLLEL